MRSFRRLVLAAFGGLLLLVLAAVALNWRRDLTLDELKPRYTDAASRFLELDGMPVHYRDEGLAADSLPLVLLHGTGASLHTWDGWVDALRGGHRVIRLDLPAYGLTGPNPAGDYSMDFYAGFVLRFLDRLGVDSFVLGGNSLGGRIAWTTALRAPERVRALVLVDAAGYPVASESRPLAFRLAGWPVVRNLFKYVTPRSVIEGSVRNVYGDPGQVTPELVDRYYDLARRTGNRQAFLDRMAGGREWSADHERIASIDIPTLILWGRRDALIPVAAAERFHEDLPRDTLVIFDDLGHVPMEEDPARTVEAVRDFLARVAPF